MNGRQSGTAQPKLDVDQLMREFEREHVPRIRNLAKIGPQELVEIARAVGEGLGNSRQPGTRQGIDLKMNQVRRFLDALRRLEKEVDEVRRAQESVTATRGTDLAGTLELRQVTPTHRGWEGIQYKLALLRPKLAYAAGREKRVKPLMTVLEPAIVQAVESPSLLFEKLLRFMEAIVAYHSYYGGKN